MCCNIQAQQKQASDANVAEKLSKLSMTDSLNERDASVRGENSAGNQLDQPPSKKTKNSSRSRRRRKGRQADAAVAVNGGATCEFVRGGGGKMHSSSGPRRDWFAIDANNKQNSLDTETHGSDAAFTRDNKDGIVRKSSAPLLTVEASTKSSKSANAATSRGKEPKNHHSAKVSDTIQGSKPSASKDFSGDKRPVAGQKNVPASTSEVNKPKLPPAQLESGLLYLYTSCEIEHSVYKKKLEYAQL